jgi:carboxypeptidase C (cathepsin A)
MSSEQPEKEKAKAQNGKLDDAKPADKSEAEKDCPPPIVTHHEVKVEGRTLAYTVTTGLMPIRNEAGDREAEIFFMAYTLTGAASGARRPVMFSFNGGPGSSSVWLHLGALGPRRVMMRDDGSLPPPPYRMEDNALTWLDQTDLVFIDPVGTGYSRPVKPEDGKKFWCVQGDVASVGEFIRLYLTRFQRWSSPLFLVGESYGTTRAAGLSDYLIEKGIALNGIVLVSSVLNFQTLLFATGNDLPYILFLPTYTATAWYHRKLADDLQSSLPDALAEAEAWAEKDYTVALGKGNGLSKEERQGVVEKLCRYTGLDARFVERSNLRIEINRFCKELLRDEGRTVGRLDSRIDSVHTPSSAEQPDFDPSMTAIRPPYTAVFNDYVRRDLGYETDREYYILGGGIKTPWDWGSSSGHVDTSEALDKAFAKNPYMKLFVASGYYDLATPYFATRYTLSHMSLAPPVRGHIQTADYEAGHMMYIHTESLRKLKSDVAAFLQFALEPDV